MKHILQIAPGDNVVVALCDLPRGENLQGITLAEDVPAGHKIAIQAIAAGEPVLKYGYPIGQATCDIAPGQHVHTHNVASSLQGNLAAASKGAVESGPEADSTRTFQGFRRADGRVGTRNEIWILPTVGCVNHTAEQIAAEAARRWVGRWPGVEGIWAFPHPLGCSQMGDDLQNTQQTLSTLSRHPNAAGVLVLGLGCEHNQIRQCLELSEPGSPPRRRFFATQEVSDEIEAGLEAVEELAEFASQFRREPIPAAELILGMKCGGSDGFSGITANPLVGRIADRQCAAGGTVLLAEVPEMFGAEPILLARAASDGVARGIVELINDFRDYFRRHGEPIDENPSPGNKDGGITTLADKSLGCVQKGGSAPVRHVLPYGHLAPARAGGLALVNTPGNDGISSTAMVAAGASMLLFTTGRGTPMGFPAPTIKIATNSDLARRKPQWIDFNAGALADGTASMDELADRLFELVLEVASGHRTKSETHGYREIAIWKNGVTV